MTTKTPVNVMRCLFALAISVLCGGFVAAQDRPFSVPALTSIAPGEFAGSPNWDLWASWSLSGQSAGRTVALGPIASARIDQQLSADNLNSEGHYTLTLTQPTWVGFQVESQTSAIAADEPMSGYPRNYGPFEVGAFALNGASFGEFLASSTTYSDNSYGYGYTSYSLWHDPLNPARTIGSSNFPLTATTWTLTGWTNGRGASPTNYYRYQVYLNAGSYTIAARHTALYGQWEIGSTGRYIQAIVTQTYDVQIFVPKTPPITSQYTTIIDAQSANKVYDGAPLSIGAPKVRPSSRALMAGHYLVAPAATTAVGPDAGDYTTVTGPVYVKTQAFGKEWDVTWMYNLQTTSASAKITPAPATFTIAPTSFVYNGSQQGPAITGNPNGATWSITSGQQNAVNAGSYSLTVTATKNYSGASSSPWFIAKADQPAPFLSANPLTIVVGKPSTLTPTGGLGTGGWEYQITAGNASISGNTLTSPIPGTVGVRVRRGGDLNYNVSPWSNTVTIQVIPNTVNLTVSTVGSGTATGAGTYTLGTSASVLGTPSYGWEFDHVSGAVTSSLNPTSIIMDSDKGVTVHFRQSLFALTTSVSGDGAITPGGTYLAGTWVTLSATPTPTSRFTGFSGDLTGTANPQNLQMNSPKNVVANFAAKLPQTIVFPNPSPVPHDSAVPLAATASSGLPVAYTVVAGTGTLTGATLHTGGAGVITVKADQVGDALYLPAPSVVIDITVWGDAKVDIESQGPNLTTSNDDSKGPGQLIIKQ